MHIIVMNVRSLPRLCWSFQLFSNRNQLDASIDRSHKPTSMSGHVNARASEKNERTWCASFDIAVPYVHTVVVSRHEYFSFDIATERPYELRLHQSVQWCMRRAAAVCQSLGCKNVLYSACVDHTSDAWNFFFAATLVVESCPRTSGKLWNEQMEN